MNTFAQDIKFGVRMLAKSPVFSLIAIVALGLGIAVNSVMFSVVNALLLRPLNFPNSHSISAVMVKSAKDGSLYSSHSYPNFRARAASSAMT